MAKTDKVAPIEFNKVKPKTKNQHDFMKAIEDNVLTICNGPAGTGKSLCTISSACDHLLSGKVEKILISRTIIPCGEIGFLPGKAEEKAEPYFYPVFMYLEQILGKNYRKYMGENKILLKPLEVLRGSNFNNTFMILEESQNVDLLQLKMFLTRIGQNSKCVLIGDQVQSDIGSAASGFRFCLNYLHQIEQCAVINLTVDDILRSGIVKDIIKVFNEHAI